MASVVGQTFFGLDLAQIKSSFSQLRRRISKRVLLIECGITSINLAEVKVHDGSISMDHIRRYALPEEAMERGIPTDPVAMAALIKGHCLEEDIPAHRAAVVIPPDAAFTTLVQLPSELAPSEALAYALDPASPIQVPIQLDQTDAELIPLELPNTPSGQRSYFLAAIPRKLIDRLLETIKLADLELLSLQIGTIAQLAQLRPVIASLAVGEVVIHVELLRECSLVTLVTKGGPFRIVRLTAIRDFPEPEEGAAEILPNQPVSTERQIVASDRYLPLSDLDIRRLSQEIKQTIDDSQLQFPWIRWRDVVLSGPNSAHPLLADLLQDAIAMPVVLCRSMAADGVGSIELKQPILVQRLGRLVGLGLSFLEQPADADSVLSSQSIRPADVVVEQQLLGAESSDEPQQTAVVVGDASLAQATDCAADESLDEEPSSDVSLPEVPRANSESHLQATQLSPDVRALNEAKSAGDLLIEFAQETEADCETLSLTPSQEPEIDELSTTKANELLGSNSQSLTTPSSSLPPSVSAFPSPPLPDSTPFMPSLLEPDINLDADAQVLLDQPSALPENQSSAMLASEPKIGEAETSDSPFSMGDLLSSFQARQEMVPEQLMPEPASVDLYQPEADASEQGQDAYLLDDPKLWPTVAKTEVSEDTVDS